MAAWAADHGRQKGQSCGLPAAPWHGCALRARAWLGLIGLVENSDFTLKSARFQNLKSEIWSTFFRFQNQKSANIFRYSESFKIWNLKSKKCAADFDGLWFWENMLAAFLKIWNLPCSKFCWQISVKSAKQIFSKSEICTVGKSDFPRIWNLPFKIWNLLLI